MGIKIPWENLNIGNLREIYKRGIIAEVIGGKKILHIIGTREGLQIEKMERREGMSDEEAEQTMKKHDLVGTSCEERGILFLTGFLIGKKGQDWIFQDRWKEIEIIAPASKFRKLEKGEKN